MVESDTKQPVPPAAATEDPHLKLRPLSRNAIPAALEKAKHYRLLNEPAAAESICRDILRIDPDNQQTLVVLVLAMTDQFGHDFIISNERVEDVIGRLTDDYERTYYSGIICERRAISKLRSGVGGGGSMAYEWFEEAMRLYEAAAEVRSANNDDPILRWNTCARLIARNRLTPMQENEMPQLLE